LALSYFDTFPKPHPSIKVKLISFNNFEISTNKILDPCQFEKHHNSLTVEDLVSIAYFDKIKTKREVRISAKKELTKRKISNKEIDELRRIIRKRKNEVSRAKLKEKENGFGVIEFVLEILMAFLHL